MYISFIYHVYIMYISDIYIYIMYISCISHLHRYIYIHTYTPFLSRNSQARGPSVPQASRSSWCVWSPKAVTRAPPSHLVEIPKILLGKKKNLYSDFNEIWVSFEFNQCYHPRIFLLYHGTVRILSHTPG